MSDNFQKIFQAMNDYALPITLVLLATVFIVYLNRRKIRQRWLDLKMHHRLNRLGVKQLSSFKCPDGLGDHFIIDRLILRREGISLLVFKCYPGKVFCADQIDDWTQMVGKKSYRFTNPLYELECQIKAVSACVPDVPVDGFLFFDHLTEFPKGHPDRVIHLKNIPQRLVRNKQDKVEASVMAGWEKLLHMKSVAK